MVCCPGSGLSWDLAGLLPREGALELANPGVRGGEAVGRALEALEGLAVRLGLNQSAVSLAVLDFGTRQHYAYGADGDATNATADSIAAFVQVWPPRQPQRSRRP